MKKRLTLFAAFFTLFVVLAATVSAMDMKDQDKSGSNKFGDLIHESMVDGYMLSYYFMDLRKQKSDGHDTGSHGASGSHEEMDKPHHLMVYVSDMDKNVVKEAKVGFLVKDAGGNSQKAMGMFMSDGFGITADMKKKGVYKITVKAVFGDKKLMDTFEYEIH